MAAPLIDAEELGKCSFYRALIAEFIATMLFLYITVLTVIGYKHQSDTQARNFGFFVGVKGKKECMEVERAKMEEERAVKCEKMQEERVQFEEILMEQME